jgi:Fe-S cluster assembly protein SufD
MKPTSIPKYQTEVPNHFQLLFENLEDQLNGERSQPFHQLRKLGGKRLMELGFPTTRNENYKYTALNRVFKENYLLPGEEKLDEKDKQLIQSEIEKCPDTHWITFVNGRLSKEMSSCSAEGLSVLSLSDTGEKAELKNTSLNRIEKSLAENDNPFIQLNTALCEDPILIHIDKNRQIDKPVQLIHFYKTADESVIVNPQIVIFAEERSQITFLETHLTRSSKREGKVFANLFERVVTEKGAKVTHNKIQEMGAEDFLIHNMVASQERDSHFYALTADLGSRITRNNLEVHLLNSFTQTDMYGLFVGGDRQHIDNQTFLDHAMPNCESREWYKGVLADHSRGVFNGKVLVRQDAQKTNAFQQNNTLLASDHARMDSKPQLEIFADDVKCSHGATIGQMEDEILFYLKSRGLNDQQAGELVKIAFLAEVFESVENETIRKVIADKVVGNLRHIYAR